MQGIRGELERVRTEEQRYNFTNQNGVIILFMVQGRRLEAGQRNDVIRLTDEINRDVYGGTHLIKKYVNCYSTIYQYLKVILLN